MTKKYQRLQIQNILFEAEDSFFFLEVLVVQSPGGSHVKPIQVSQTSLWFMFHFFLPGFVQIQTAARTASSDTSAAAWDTSKINIILIDVMQKDNGAEVYKIACA